MAEMNMLAGNGVNPVDIDPSIILRAGQGVTPMQNPLDTFGKVAALRNTLDTNAAINAHTAQTQQTTAQSAQEMFQKGFSEFLALPPHMQTQGVARQLVDGYLNAKIIGPAQHAQAVAVINGTPDREGLVNFSQRALLKVQSPAGQMQALTPAATAVNTGGETVPVSVPSGFQRIQNPALPGMTPTGGNMTGTLSPGEQNNVSNLPEMGPDGKPTGRMQPVTGTDIARRGGNAQLLPGGAAPASPSAGLLRGQPPPWRNPGGAAQPPSAAPSPQAAAPPAPSGLGTLRAPEESAAAIGGTEQSTKYFGGVADRGSQARLNQGRLGNILADTSLYRTGPGTDLWLKFGRLAEFAGLPGPGAEKITSAESARKLLNDIVNSQNSGSDARAAIAQSSNPSDSMSPGGLKYMVEQALGLEKYHEAVADMGARAPAAQRQDHTQFQAEVRRKLNPQTFQFQALSDPEQRRMFYNGLKEDQKRELRQSLPPGAP